MPDPQKKLVQVNGLGVIEFPGGMQDDQIAATIKRHKAQTHSSSPHFTGKSTEESEKARQLKPAQPLDSAIPTLPKWANTPLAPILDKKVDYVDRALWPGGTANWDKLTAESEADKQRFMGKHPIAGGVFEGVNETAEGLTSPANLALMIAAPESKIMSGLFAIQALHGSYKDIEEARKAYREGRNAEASKYATQAVLNLGIAGLAGHHAVKDIPVPEPVKDFARSEEGSVGSQEKVQNPEAENKTVKMLTDGKAGGYRLDHLLKNHPDVTITSVGTESLNPATLKRIQGWTRESKLDDWKNTNANVKDMPPVEVVRTPHGDYLYDGTHRTEFATRQGEKVPATVYTIKTKGDAVTPVAPKIADVKAKAAELQPTTAYKSADQSQPFYLKSENLVSEKMKGPMPAEDVHKMLLSNGVKPEEMKWTGLDELLQGKGKNKVTPQEIKDHLAENNLQIKEVTKESDSGNLKSRLVSQFNSFVYAGQKELGIQADKVAEEIESGVNPETAIKRFVPNPSPELLKSGKYLYDTGREVENARQAGPTKFGSYVLPGGENYRELLLTMPPKTVTQHFLAYKGGPTIGTGYSSLEEAQAEMEDLFPNRQDIEIRQGRGDRSTTTRTPDNFRSNHWDEPNVLGHVRFNDRVGPNGEKILHLEELQSDWHQKGRAKGYKEPKITKLPDGYKVSAVPKGQYGGLFEVLDPTGKYVSSGTNPEDAVFFALERLNEHNQEQRIPDAPFKKNWHELMLKRMMKYAAENGYDGISWTPGEQQAERYDLSKQVDAIHYRSAGPRMFSVEAYRQGVGTVLSQTGTPEELEGVVGKDIVRKMVAKEGKEVGGPGDFRKLTGVDLKVGGEGMKGFYDKIIPDAANKIGKQWGAKVGETKIVAGKEPTQLDWTDPTGNIEEARFKDGNDKEHVVRVVQDEKRPREGGGFEGGLYDLFIDGTRLEHNIGRTQALREAVEEANKLGRSDKKQAVPYLPITPQMRTGVKSIPFSLFSIPLAAGALTLAQVKAKAEELKKRSGVQ